jgi:hypothetical protein
MTSRWSYRRWDGTQRGFEDEIDALFSELSDDLLYHGDPDAALRRLLNSGFQRPDGERVQGLREMMERLRQQRSKRSPRSSKRSSPRNARVSRRWPRTPATQATSAGRR